jgi:oligopeptide transport system ATP-binding protein
VNALLSVCNLSVSFLNGKKRLRALRGLSFDLYENEIVGIVGESGSGKSVAAKALLRLLPAHTVQIEGRVRYRSRDLLTLSEADMRAIRGKEIGMIFQDPMTSLNPTLKVGFQITETLKHLSKQEAHLYAATLLASVGVPSPDYVLDTYPHTLSGGMRQRVMVALALASKPRLLIADEPTTALDVTIQAQLLSLLKRIQQQTATSVLLITHDLSIVAGICDRVLVMYAGQIVESASVDQLFYAPAHPYTQRLLASLPRLDHPRAHPLQPIEGTPPSLDALPSGCPFHPRCQAALPLCRQAPPPQTAGGKEHRCACWRTSL